MPISIPSTSPWVSSAEVIYGFCFIHCSTEYSTLDIRVATRDEAIPEGKERLYRLGCLDKCLGLALSFLDVYSTHFPAPTVLQMFSGLANLDGDLNTDNLPVGIEMKAKQLVDQLGELKAQPRPKDIVTKDKISLVLANKDATPQALQKVGLVPLLEPQFDEK